MHVTLLHKPGSGEGTHHRADLLALFRAQGHTVTYRRQDEDGWQDVLDAPADLVVAAGGDGTVSSVAKALAGRGVPLGMLALGTANNIARHHRLVAEPRDMVPRFEGAPRRPLDLGVACGPWGETRFVESAGWGACASAIAFGKAGKGPLLHEPVEREAMLELDLCLLRAHLRDAAPRPCTLTLDDAQEQRNLLFVKVQNVRCSGPNVPFAPDADSTDGWLDIVVMEPRHREVVERYLTARLDGQAPGPLGLPVRRARQLRLSSPSARTHTDGRPWPAPDTPLPAGAELDLTFSIEPTALEVLVPE